MKLEHVLLLNAILSTGVARFCAVDICHIRQVHQEKTAWLPHYLDDYCYNNVQLLTLAQLLSGSKLAEMSFRDLILRSLGGGDIFAGVGTSYYRFTQARNYFTTDISEPAGDSVVGNCLLAAGRR